MDQGTRCILHKGSIHFDLKMSVYFCVQDAFSSLQNYGGHFAKNRATISVGISKDFPSSVLHCVSQKVGTKESRKYKNSFKKFFRT
jgi:hypothetical protein